MDMGKLLSADLLYANVTYSSLSNQTTLAI